MFSCYGWKLVDSITYSEVFSCLNYGIPLSSWIQSFLFLWGYGYVDSSVKEFSRLISWFSWFRNLFRNFLFVTANEWYILQFIPEFLLCNDEIRRSLTGRARRQRRARWPPRPTCHSPAPRPPSTCPGTWPHAWSPHNIVLTQYTPLKFWPMTSSHDCQWKKQLKNVFKCSLLYC